MDSKNSITITIAGRTYEVHKLTIKANKAWRKTYEKPINDLLNATKAVGELSQREFEDTKALVKEIGLILLAHADSIVRVLLESTDTISEAVFAYSPEMNAERAFIEANGFDEEMTAAFLEVVKLAFPFTSVFQAMSKLGQMAQPTSPNSPSQSGESGKMI